MTHQITLSNQKILIAESGQTLLEAAAQNSLTLEHSCRTGRCGVCKALVLSGDTVVIKSEESLSEADLKSGYILTCCRSANSDVRLDIEDLGELGSIKPKTLPCRIDSLNMLSDDVIQVLLRTPPNNTLEYLPGQYVDMIGKDGLRRSYSIANAPRTDGKIELQIRKVENGLMSNYWFNQAKPNDLLRMEGPLGTFCLRRNQTSHLILLATGTGIAPIKAILEDLSQSPSKNHYAQISLYWGGRTESDIYWQPSFENLPLTFIPVLSRQKSTEVRNGYVQNVVLDDHKDLSNSAVYACGSEAMIDSANQALTAAGLNGKNFYSDAFVSSN